MKISAVVFASLLFAIPALAHDHAHPDFNAWYQSLNRPDMHGNGQYMGGGGSFSCCNQLDCHPTEAEIRGNDWYARAVVVRNGEQVNLDDWLRIPPEKVIHNKDNPTGYPVLCYSPSWSSNGNLDHATSTIYCFVPEAQF